MSPRQGEHHEDATSREPPPVLQSRVVVVWDGGTMTKALPPRGTVTIGRGMDCDVQVDHASVSRRHASLHVGDEVLECGPGSMVRVPPDVIHYAEAVGDEVCLNLDVFAPVRVDYLHLVEYQKT